MMTSGASVSQGQDSQRIVSGEAYDEHVSSDGGGNHSPSLQPRQCRITEGDMNSTPRFARTVLIALDNSIASDKAFEWAMHNFIRPQGNDLVVLTTVREPVLVPGAYGYMDFGEYISEAEEKSRLQAHALIKLYGQKMMKHYGMKSAMDPDFKIVIKGVVMRGDPRDELIRKAEELNASALIIGSRGQNKLKRVLLGSVSDYIAHHCKIPVICVKTSYEATEEELKQEELAQQEQYVNKKMEDLNIQRESDETVKPSTSPAAKKVEVKSSAADTLEDELRWHMMETERLQKQLQELSSTLSSSSLEPARPDPCVSPQTQVVDDNRPIASLYVDQSLQQSSDYTRSDLVKEGYLVMKGEVKEKGVKTGYLVINPGVKVSTQAAAEEQNALPR
ncbi:hypothetical protein MIR68_010977 [Amoeboaphelidium protococcarum]|nr:hypothetical protein MIR68_010977 [Amoeboaphelidium protococcarum]